MLVCTLVPRNINIWNSLPERLVKCGTVQTFRRHLDRNDLSKFITYQQSACAACIYCYILLFSFFQFVFFIGGRYQYPLGPSLPRS